MRSIDAVARAGVLTFAVGLAAAAGPVVLEVTVPGEAVRVGDRVPVRVTARGGDDLLWGELRVAVDPEGPWVMVEAPHEVAGARPPVWEMILAPMEVADLDLPPMTAAVREPAGAAAEISVEEAPSITVDSVLPDGDEVEPVPLRDPVGVSGFPWEWVVPLSVPVLIAAAVLALWSRRRRPDGTTHGEIPARPPLAEIEALLDRLGERLGREPLEGICDRLAAGMRRYLERQSNQPAEDMTSFELRLLARRLGWSDNVQRGIQEVMAVTDSVRFGRVPTDEARLRRILDLAREVARDLNARLLAQDAADEAEEAAG